MFTHFLGLSKGSATGSVVIFLSENRESLVVFVFLVRISIMETLSFNNLSRGRSFHLVGGGNAYS